MSSNNGNQQQPQHFEPLVELLLPMLQVAATCDNTVEHHITLKLDKETKLL
jgi:hypothetical protein